MSEMTSKNTRGAYSKSENTRARLIQAGLDEAREGGGFQNTSIAKIAARAGVAIGVVNYHFHTKEALLHEIVKEFSTGVVARMAPIDDELGFFTSYANNLTKWVTFFKANPTFMILVDEMRVFAPDLYLASVKRGVRDISEELRRGIELGELAPMSDAEILNRAYFLLGMNRFLDRLLLDERCDPEDVVRQCTEFLRLGLGTAATS
jgi:AcrR family transcriptional regulator